MHDIDAFGRPIAIGLLAGVALTMFAQLLIDWWRRWRLNRKLQNSLTLLRNAELERDKVRADILWAEIDLCRVQLEIDMAVA